MTITELHDNELAAVTGGGGVCLPNTVSALNNYADAHPEILNNKLYMYIMDYRNGIIDGIDKKTFYKMLLLLLNKRALGSDRVFEKIVLVALNKDI